VYRVGIGERTGVLAEAFGKLLHHPIDLLRLSRQPEPREKVSEGLVNAHSRKGHEVHVSIQHGLVELVAFAHIVTHGALVKARGLEEPGGDSQGGHFEEAGLAHYLKALLRLQGEGFDALLQHGLVLLLEKDGIDLLLLLPRHIATLILCRRRLLPELAAGQHLA